MSWPVLIGLVVILGLAFLLSLARRAELARMRSALKERERLERVGSTRAQLQYPVIDLSRCLGCATCVAVCPEDGVLEIVHGQAVVVNGTRCQGIAACERECPVGAVTVTIANLENRRDVPALTPDFEAIGAPGLFLAGEVTAHALIKTAIEHGEQVGGEVARRTAEAGPAPAGVLDLCIVGAGPAGLACSLEAKRHGLMFVTLDQADGLGGTVAKYPRRKLVMTEPVDLPLHGRMKRTNYTKEELMDLWQSIAENHQLPIETGEVFTGLERSADGVFAVHTERHTYRARHVCLALGRRGTPRRLGVPGEELPKVAYSLLDANSYQGRRILVVGGGDSAVEAAMGLAEQPGNQVTISYRRESFFRIRSKNQERLEQAIQRDSLQVLYESRVTAIRPHSVEVAVTNGATHAMTLPNDDVFVMAGGMAPFQLLTNSGVSFDPALRPPPPRMIEQGTGLVPALGAGFLLALLALVFALWNLDYYELPRSERAVHDKHGLLRPGLGLGLWLGIAAAAMVLVNLFYLVRRSPGIPFTWGSLRAWMTSHVATGILALLCATLHGAMEPRNTAGGHAFWGLLVLLVTGAIGRYFYAYVPRAANGRELELSEARSKLEQAASDWDESEFGHHVRAEVMDVIDARQWTGSFFGRVAALFGARRDLHRALQRLEQEGKKAGVEPARLKEILALAKRAHSAALTTAHFEDLRAILGTWRYAHRWVAVLMVLLIVLHVVSALTYGAHYGSAG